MNGRTKLLLVLAVTSIGACSKKKNDQAAVPTVQIARRDIIVTAQATGTVEPEDTVPVKSQASGLVMKMPVEIGQVVKPGDLLVQIDTRTLNNDYQRTKSAEAAAEANVTVTKAALQRANDLYAQKVITADEHETAIINAANATCAAGRCAGRAQHCTTEPGLRHAPVAGIWYGHQQDRRCRDGRFIGHIERWWW